MAKMVNCKICGQRCEEKMSAFGVLGLLFGIPIRPSNLCSDECYRKWHGEGRIWFGAKWRKHVITTLIVLAILVVLFFILIK